MKHNLLLLFLILTILCTTVASAPYRTAQGDRIIKANLNGTTYFATTHAAPKLHDTELGNTQRNVARFTALVDDWYSDNCAANEVLHALVDTVIQHFTDNPTALHTTDGKQPLAIFDIDETTLSPYFFVKARIIERTKQGIPDDEDIHPTPEQFTSLQPIKRLYDFFIEQGIAVAFITARDESRRGTTTQDLLHHGFATYAALITMPSWFKLSGGLYKELARTSLAKKYEIIMNVDDGHPNLQGEHVGRYAVWLPTPLERRLGEDQFLQTLINAIE